MLGRKQYIEQLANGFIIDNNIMQMGNVSAHFLNNPLTKHYCQIVEAKGIVLATTMVYHMHQNSKEIFYQITGTAIFSDGQILKEGELKIIGPNTLHNVSFSEGVLCIVIIHPIESVYPLGGGGNG